MKKQNTEKDYFHLWVCLLDTVKIVTKVRERELDNYEVTLNTSTVLDCIKSFQDNPPTPSQIARRLIREPQSTSGILNRLQERGFVTKSVDSERKNVIRISLTKDGEDKLKYIRKRKAIKNILCTLNDSEIQQLEVLLKKIQIKGISQMRKQMSLRKKLEIDLR